MMCFVGYPFVTNGICITHVYVNSYVCSFICMYVIPYGLWGGMEQGGSK
jgi:hypothetical protein